MCPLTRAVCGRGPVRAGSTAQYLTGRRIVRRCRSTLSKIWVPTGGIAETESESGHDKLIRAGFLRQSQAGIFQLLPLGLRVQNKIEKLIDKHMESIGASRLSLSTITSEELWKKSDRLDSVAPELFRLKDRKEVSLMLSPTHEEEITTLVANAVQSYKDLPLRLYQITRKYRDEMRPRQGLLRSREFLMKDLYTFDLSSEAAIETYQQVQAAYKAIFDEMKVQILVAEASSGDMGGNHSHEYHLADSTGEDTVAHCNSCEYTANDEVAISKINPQHALDTNAPSSYGLWRGITKDRNTLINAWYPQSDGGNLNVHAVKTLVPELDTSVHDPLPLWEVAVDNPETALVNIVDSRLAPGFGKIHSKLALLPEELQDDFIGPQFATSTATNGDGLNLLALAEGDGCPRCESGTLKISRALELGHTFYLGTRYSKPLEALVSLPEKPSQPIPIQMGCFGIGVSRIFGAVAENRADSRGLNWPRAIAPFEVAVIPSSAVNDEMLAFFDSLVDGGSFDAVLDDRKKAFGWKMKDADITGYPVVVVLGKAWRERGVCEVQCRSLELKQEVAASELPMVLEQLLQKL
ncbi:prolyl-tRNA synthetase [Cordyceps militaris CM01]|uniref:proline--tRNA ligase n=1 Tax=Cordyceps militaris (strain CM01) TaxID=983644 RepID=G3JN44_CORMM|nr:prolyl-tRNA synthetase [Cordyceps militaris CM01]EGX90226.1 prolyl-tRNA synthetase [Cordyceps militaris CM01]